MSELPQREPPASGHAPKVPLDAEPAEQDHPAEQPTAEELDELRERRAIFAHSDRALWLMGERWRRAW
jgi:hypothetical protein